MKYLETSDYGVPMVELSRRNLQTLLRKLDDPGSMCTILDGEHNIAVKAVDDSAHYKARLPGAMLMPSTGEVF